jgi:hypothetical protein
MTLRKPSEKEANPIAHLCSAIETNNICTNQVNERAHLFLFNSPAIKNPQILSIFLQINRSE